jgi:hypothetical protein
MELISAVRSLMPVPETVSPTPPLDQRADLRRPQGAQPPVANTGLADALQQVIARPSTIGPMLIGDGDQLQVSATATAEAARAAYIKASIAAGINPLPLP